MHFLFSPAPSIFPYPSEPKQTLPLVRSIGDEGWGRWLSYNCQNAQELAFEFLKYTFFKDHRAGPLWWDSELPLWPSGKGRVDGREPSPNTALLWILHTLPLGCANSTLVVPLLIYHLQGTIQYG